MKKKLVLPKFKNEDEERDFWSKHSFLDYVDPKKVLINPSLPKLKFSTKSISMRLPSSLISDLKVIANKKDVPYQSLIKVYLADIVKKFPNFFINNFLAFDENHQKKVCGNERLGNILKSDEIIELFQTYEKGNEIWEQFQKDKIAYRHGERKTHPLQDKPSWLERIDKLFEGKSHLDEFSVSVQNQIIRQHSANNFLYSFSVHGSPQWSNKLSK